MRLLGLLLIHSGAAQHVGTISAEDAPTVSLETCTKGGGCQAQSHSVTLDANWRWVHTTSGDGTTNCYSDSAWDSTLCPDPDSCVSNCAIDGVDGGQYLGTYGVKSFSGGLELAFVTQGPYGKNVGSRLYMLDGSNYKMFKLLNKEFTFDVDVQTLACGLNGALYFVEMKADGGRGGGNKAGAKYGTGYCDAQCPHDLKFMGGTANVKGWDPKAAAGKLGHCCSELDIWEANAAATAFTPHPCSTEGPLVCTGTQCGDSDKNERYQGVCDKDGCDFNAYRAGNTTFFGPGSNFAVDSTRPITVVTQFITSDGTDNGDFAEMRRFYVQDGRVIPNSMSTTAGAEGNSVTDDYCAAQKHAFGDKDDFSKKGGMRQMGGAMRRGMVLVMSLWDDHITDMVWLDARAPPDAPITNPGVARGSCSTDSGKPEDLRTKHSSASVKYYNFKFGDIGSTFSCGSGLACSNQLSPKFVPDPPTTTTRATTTTLEPTTTTLAPTRTTTTETFTTTTLLATTTTATATETATTTTDTTTTSSSFNAQGWFCCFAAWDQTSRRTMCNTCQESGMIRNTSWCGQSEQNCLDCSGTGAAYCHSDNEPDLIVLKKNEVPQIQLDTSTLDASRRKRSRAARATSAALAVAAVIGLAWACAQPHRRRPAGGHSGPLLDLYDMETLPLTVKQQI